MRLPSKATRRLAAIVAVLSFAGWIPAWAGSSTPASNAAGPGLSYGSKGAQVSGPFAEGTAAYARGDYSVAAAAFERLVAVRPSSGALHNLGNAEWHRGRTGAAILAWEQALWLDPSNRAAQNNARFARKQAQLESPELTWFEVVSTWLPVNWWAWITGGSLWLAVGTGLLPGILRWRRASWHQALAALSLALFLLSLPAHLGIRTRGKIGFVLPKDVSLRLTPTEEAQVLTRLASGEPARLERGRGKFILIRTSRGRGWIQRDQFGLTCPPA